MSETELSKLVLSVKNTLTKNGFPEKRVSLPLEKMYEVAHNQGLNFNKVLKALEVEDIHHEMTTDRIIFSSLKVDTTATDLLSKMDPESFKGMDLSKLMAQANEMLQKMSPEEKKRMEDMHANLSDQDKEELLRKAKEMGIV